MFPENRALADSYGNSSAPQPVVVQRFSSLEDSHLVGPLRDIGFAVPSMNPAKIAAGDPQLMEASHSRRNIP